MNSISIPFHKISETINQLSDSGFDLVYSSVKHRYTLQNQNGTSMAFFRLPINFQITSGQFEQEEELFIIVLIQSGSCALGVFQADQVLDHKVIKSYMVRKKQGKSQVKYLNKKGKSRAGSRVRLSNTLDFFDAINERLTDYLDEFEIEKIAMSCSKSLIPYLHNGKISCPFDKKDERLYKIPKHIVVPNFEVLLSTHEFLLTSEITFEDEYRELMERLLL